MTPPRPQPASVVDHDDYQLEIEPSLYPAAAPAAPAPSATDNTSAALLSLLQRARAQTGEQPQATARPAASAAVAQPNHKTLLDPEAHPDLDADDLDAAFEEAPLGADAFMKRAARPSDARQAARAETSRRGSTRDADDLDANDDIEIDEDGFEIGDLDDLKGLNGVHEPDAFGEEDSGPVPTSAEPRRGGTSARTRRGPKQPRRVQASPLGGVFARAKGLAARVSPRAQLAMIAALMLIGLSYVFFGGEDPAPDAASQAAAQAPTAQSAPAAPAAAPTAGALGAEDPNAQLIPLDGADIAHATNNHPLYPLSALAPAASPQSNKLVQMSRTCVLRDGPASRFKALVKQTPATAKVIVLAESESDWRLITHQGLTGWAKGACNPGACDLRQGPSASFKVIRAPEESLKTSGPLTSGDRWRYVKFEDTYGWMGPACWK